MNTRLIRNVLLGCVLLAAFTVSAAQVQPRALQGDNVEAPKSILLNQKKTISGVEAATRQTNVIEATACDGSNLSENSVWFGFEAPAFALVDIDTSGSVLNYRDNFTRITMLSLYRVNGPALEEIICVTGASARLLDMELYKGSYKVRIASPYASLVGPSSYRLGLRVRSLGALGDDSELTAPLGTVWKVKNEGNPPRIFHSCANDCVRFDGVAGGKILTKLDWNTLNVKAKTGDMFSTNIFVNDTPAAGSEVKVTIQLIYSDGTPSNRYTVTRHIAMTGTGASVGVGTAIVEIKSSALKTVKLVIASPDAVDTFSVEYATVYMAAGSNVRGLLPVPPANEFAPMDSAMDMARG